MDGMELVFLIVLMNYVLLACLMWFVIGKMSKGAIVVKSPSLSKKMMHRREVADAVERDVSGGADDDASSR
jgi:hypothetical protein